MKKIILLYFTFCIGLTGCKVAQQVDREYKCIDSNDGHLMLINNAYITSFRQSERSVEGYEMYFISNYSHCVPLDLDVVRRMYYHVYENFLKDIEN